MQNTEIPVFLSADNTYAPFVATTIASICEHTHSFINFYVLDGGIPENKKNKIMEMSKKFQNFSLEFLTIDVNKIFSNFANNLHYSKTMFARFFIPTLKPELNKVLYSDVDVIFLDDIKKMYDEDIGNYALGAVEECWLNDHEKEEMRKYWGTSSEHKIFASGNLIIDCEKWRQLDITQKLFEINQQRTANDLWVDQILLNKLFDNNYKVIPPKYCYTIQHDTCFGKTNDIIVCHYNGAVKPWQINEDTRTQNMPYLQEFWYYAKKTPFYDELKLQTINKEQQRNNLIKLQAWRLKIKLANKGNSI